MTALDQPVVGVDLHSIRIDLGGTIEGLEWTVNAYTRRGGLRRGVTRTTKEFKQEVTLAFAVLNRLAPSPAGATGCWRSGLSPGAVRCQS
jgi:hypothetical protein